VKIAIVGSRDYPKMDLVKQYITDNLSKEKDVVVSGGARGSTL